MSRSSLINWLEKIVEGSFLAAIFILPVSIALMEMSYTISFIAWLLLKFLKKENLCQDQFLFLIVGLFLIVSSVSAFYSGYPEVSVRGLLKIIKYSFVFLIAADFFGDKKRLNHLIWAAILSFVIVLGDCLIQLATGKDLIRGFEIYHADSRIRLTGPYKFYGLLAAQLIAILPLLLSLIWTGKNSRRKIFIKSFLFALFLIGFLVLFQTQSRGAWLASYASWFVYMLLSKNKKMLIFLILLTLSLPFVVPKDILIHEDIHNKEQSLIERYHLWERAGQVIAKRPIFGCGINTYVKNYPLYDEVKNWRVPGYYVHNGYLQLAAETGLISLFLFLFLILRSISSGLKAVRVSSKDERMRIVGIFSGVVALLIQASFDTTLHNLQSAVLIWLFLGLLIGLKRSAASTF